MLSVKKHPGVGHPWDGRPGFDHLEINASTEAERDAAVQEAEKKFWHPWLVGFTCDIKGEPDFAKPSAILYKPTGQHDAWTDDPKARHPGTQA